MILSMNFYKIIMSANIVSRCGRLKTVSYCDKKCEYDCRAFRRTILSRFPFILLDSIETRGRTLLSFTSTVSPSESSARRSFKNL